MSVPESTGVGRVTDRVIVRKSWKRTFTVTVRPASRGAGAGAATASAMRTASTRRRVELGVVTGEGLLVADRLRALVGHDRRGRRCRGRAGRGGGRGPRRGRATRRRLVEVGEVGDGPDAEAVEHLLGLRPDAPERPHRQRVEEGELVAGLDDDDAGPGPGPGRRGLRLGRLRRQLGQELVRRHADRAGEPLLVEHRGGGCAAAIAGGSPNSRVAPPTSRNASSRLSGSTSGVTSRKIAITRLRHLGVVGVVAGQEDRVRAQPPGPHRRHRRVHAVGPGLVAGGGDDAPVARARRRPPACPAAPGCRSSSTDTKNASMSTWRMCGGRRRSPTRVTMTRAHVVAVDPVAERAGLVPALVEPLRRAARAPTGGSCRGARRTRRGRRRRRRRRCRRGRRRAARPPRRSPGAPRPAAPAEAGRLGDRPREQAAPLRDPQAGLLLDLAGEAVEERLAVVHLDHAAGRASSRASRCAAGSARGAAPSSERRTAPPTTHSRTGQTTAAWTTSIRPRRGSPPLPPTAGSTSRSACSPRAPARPRTPPPPSAATSPRS